MGDEPGLDNDVVGEEVNSDDEEVDPDDATPDVMADGWEEPNPNNDDKATGEDSENPIGIAFTLKKIDYICSRIASSPQKQAEWKVWAAKLGFTGRGVINGYRIRWNIAYESRQRAYDLSLGGVIFQVTAIFGDLGKEPMNENESRVNNTRDDDNNDLLGEIVLTYE
ncbi:hypothetical protein H4Q26_010865 [Puccinia striiformis f. sp. tritici PST-130]|nr:hypothetical protein H4Q26_010865 [Puccinia striiformis f. sp. tritici PST-130]